MKTLTKTTYRYCTKCDSTTAHVGNECQECFSTNHFFRTLILLLILVIAAFSLHSCAIQKQSFAMIAKDIYPTVGGYVHKFESLSGKYTFESDPLDSALCSLNDTLKISVKGRRVYFEK